MKKFINNIDKELLIIVPTALLFTVLNFALLPTNMLTVGIASLTSIVFISPFVGAAIDKIAPYHG